MGHSDVVEMMRTILIDMDGADLADLFNREFAGEGEGLAYLGDGRYELKTDEDDPQV